MLYFKINNKEEQAEQTRIERLLDWLLLKVVPMANPDFEQKFPYVKCWYIEYDEMNQYTTREIEIDKDGNVLTKAPFLQNLGIWCDSDVTYDVYKSFEIEIITKEEFNRFWEAYIVC